MSSSSQPSPTTKEHDRGPKYWLEFVALFIGTAAVFTSLGTTIQPKAIERQDASYYFTDIYFPMAREDPDRALEELTTVNYKQLKVGQQPEFSDFWSSIEDNRDVKVHEVGENEAHANRFDVSWKWIYKSGRKPTPEETRTTLVCVNWFANYIPFVYCDKSDIRLDDSQRKG